MIIIWLNDYQKYRLVEDGRFFYSNRIETLDKFKAKFPHVDVAEVTNNLDRISSSFRNNINLNIAVSNIVFQLAKLTS
jgi:hypothetical protein